MVALNMMIRTRAADDIPACIQLLAQVHRSDAYPLHWPAHPDRWLTPSNLVTAWVAEHAGDLLGHIALCSTTGESGVPLWEAASGVPAERMVVVARLFVAPRTRGQRVGFALIDEALAEARAHDLLPVLEVLDHNRAAISLYEGMGWRYITSSPAPWAQGNGVRPLLHYYIADA